MKQKMIALLGAFAVAALTVGCAQTDAGVTTKVKSKMAADDTVKAYQIDVDTQDKVVTLTGTVDNAAAKEQAVLIARGTDGVVSVVDHLTVAGPAEATTGEAAKDAYDDTVAAGERAADKTVDAAKGAAEKTGDALKSGAEKTGDAAKRVGAEVKEGAGHAGEVMSDAAITAAVKTKFLADTQVGGLKIDVDTKDGVVTLTGNVKSAAERAEARRLAADTHGVKRVVIHLNVVP